MSILLNVRSSLLLGAAITSALSAGIFFAFSTFVMKALAQQVPSGGISAMQSINITVINPWFLAVFFSPLILGILVLLSLLVETDSSLLMYGGVATLVYLIGTVGVAFGGNIPLNDALAIVSPSSNEGLVLWANYVTHWTDWTHVRTIAGVVSALMFSLALKL